MDHFNNKKFNFFRAIQVNFVLSPVASIILLIETVISGIVPTLQILAFADLIHAAAKISSEKSSVGDIVFPLAAVILLLAYQLLVPSLTHLVKRSHSNHVQKRFSVEAIEKCAVLEYRHIEDPDTLDLISRIMKDGEVKMIELYTTVLEAAALITRIVGLTSVLLAYAGGVALAILLLAIPLFALAMKAGKKVYDAEVEVAKYKRKCEYYTELLAGRNAADERALFGYTGRVNQEWEQQHAAFRKIMNITEIKNNARLEGGSIITSLITTIAIIFLLRSVFQGQLRPDMFISLVISITQLIEIMSFNFTDVVNRITNGTIFTQDMERFFSLSEDRGAIDLPQTPPVAFESLEFRNVKFRYAEGLPYVLDGVSFTIQAGLHYAFVGENGAGKTTIIKLIAGLYQNYEGEILLNGKDMKAYSSAQRKSLLSIAYQDFARYSISLEDNIALGALNNKSVNVDEAIHQAGLDEVVASLPEGKKTVLGRIKEGSVDLSGGEWQKIAIARNLVGSGSICVFDEPTASLDPLAENRIYERFDQISKNKTTILISHRLGSTKLADIIFVIDKGRIAESGTSSNLLQKHGLYRDMFDAQRSWYI